MRESGIGGAQLLRRQTQVAGRTGHGLVGAKLGHGGAEQLAASQASDEHGRVWFHARCAFRRRSAALAAKRGLTRERVIMPESKRNVAGFLCKLQESKASSIH